MNRSLGSRLSKLEGKRRMDDDDLTRLTEEELNRRIEEVTQQIIESYGGIDNTIAALRADPNPQLRALAESLGAGRSSRKGRSS